MSVALVVGGVVPAGTAVSLAAAVAGRVAVNVGRAATGEGDALGWDAAWAQAISSRVANAARNNQRAMGGATSVLAAPD